MAILLKKRAEKPDSSMLYNDFDLPQKCAFLYAFIFTSSINQLLKIENYIYIYIYCKRKNRTCNLVPMI